MDKNVSESIKRVRLDNTELVFSVEEPFYLIELLENHNKDYVHKHYSERNDEVIINHKDYSGDVMDMIGDVGYVRVCNRCDCEVVFDDDLVSKGEPNNYDCACLNCDEDLWFFETHLSRKENVELFGRFISDEDKKYYNENGCLPL